MSRLRLWSSHSYSSGIRDLILSSLSERKLDLTLVVVGAIIVSFCQAMVIFIFGPVFKSLFTLGHEQSISLSEIIPEKFLSFWPSENLVVSLASFFSWLPVVLGVIALIRGIALYAVNLYQDKISLYMSHRFRTASFQKIIEQPYLKIAEKSAAEWMSHIMNDIMFVQQSFSDLFKSLIKDGLTLVGAVLALAFINGYLTGLLLVLIFPALWILGRIAQNISAYTELVQKKLAYLAALCSDFVARFHDIFVHRGMTRELSHFQKANHELFTSQKKSIFLRSIFAPSLEIIGFLAFSTFIFLYARGWLDIDPSFLLQFVVALGISIKPLRNLGEQFSKLQETRGAIAETIQLLNAEAPLTQERHNDPLHLPIAITKVVISYQDKIVVTRQNLKLAARDTVVISGPSGSGKSTLVKCLAGVIPPQIWEANISWESLKFHTAFVSQNPFVFDGTIAENIFYGLDSQDISPQKAIAWASELGLHDVIAKEDDLERPINTMLTTLSGGQKQRLTILRALLQEKPIMLLDEATSALDIQTEEQVLDFLHREMQRRQGLLLFVTHRPVRERDFSQKWTF